jgi:hypothetical protein
VLRKAQWLVHFEIPVVRFLSRFVLFDCRCDGLNGVAPLGFYVSICSDSALTQFFFIYLTLVCDARRENPKFTRRCLPLNPFVLSFVASASTPLGTYFSLYFLLSLFLFSLTRGVKGDDI